VREKRWARPIDHYLGIPLCAALGVGAKVMARLKPPSERKVFSLLVIKFSAVGDTILLTPALSALRQHFPDAFLTFLCTPVNLQVVEHIPHVDDILCFEGPRSFLRTVRTLRARQFDLVIDFEQWMRTSALLTVLSGAPRRLGFDTPGQHRAAAYTQTFRPLEGLHEVGNFLRLALLAGATPTGERPRLWLSDDDRAKALEILGDIHRPLVAIHPGCGAKGAPREWFPEYYGLLADRLVEEQGATIVITGGASEKALVEQVADMMMHPPLTLAGGLSVTQFAAVLEQCDLLICGNTGAMHIAAAVGTPTVALHGPTNPRKWGPVGEGHVVIQSRLPCSPCLNLGWDYGCRSHPCMSTISVEEVYRAALKVLRRQSPAFIPLAEVAV
jgi:lipopolysaccharide heptosyltransferase II